MCGWSQHKYKKNYNINENNSIFGSVCLCIKSEMESLDEKLLILKMIVCALIKQ